MAHDVYICYDERDLETAKSVCDVLEDNGVECWLKNRDAGVKNIVNEIMDAIKKSKVMVLLYSKDSKNSNFVNNEVDIAFAEKRSILVYQIDENDYKISLRAKDYMEVDKIAVEFGGGGHVRAAGASFDGNLEANLKKILELIGAQIR